MIYEETSKIIIKCAYNVHRKLGFGFLEKVYKNALLIELKKYRLNAEPDYKVNVKYDNKLIGEYITDIIVNKKIIIEIKSVKALIKKHEVQLVNYLKGTGIEVGLLINFGESVEIKRKVLSLNYYSM